MTVVQKTVLPLTTEELSTFLQSWFCGCGCPEEACEILRRLLDAHPLHSKRDIDEIVSPTLMYFILYTLDHFDLTEHGGGVGGAWLSAKGSAVLAALNRESVDGYVTVLKHRCTHGRIAGEESCPKCAAFVDSKTGEEIVDEYWLAHYTVGGICTLCGNSGRVATNAPTLVGRKDWCLCPNGRSLRRQSGRR
jgi:hypothetical protein